MARINMRIRVAGKRGAARGWDGDEKIRYVAGLPGEVFIFLCIAYDIGEFVPAVL